MNPINAAAAQSLLPLPSTRAIAAPQGANDATTVCVQASGRVDQVTWSPSLWGLLNRYEYLFLGMLPGCQQSAEVIQECRQDGSDDAASLASAKPHWNEKTLLNPPPAAATFTTAEPAVVPSTSAEVIQPCAGSIVDLLA
ncbi:MAG: hypothetical protein P8M22_11420 [Phycisphaerales bacterium]|nr:hypothetical protein [Phycisphaerales bacterium]